MLIPHPALDPRRRARDHEPTRLDNALRGRRQLGAFGALVVRAVAAGSGVVPVAVGREPGADGRDHVFEVAGPGDQRPVGGEVGADGRGAGFDAGPHDDADFVVWGA